MQNLLEQKGLRVTKARLAILNIFYENRVPISAEYITNFLQRYKAYKNTNEATVYRTLAIFEQSGLIDRVYTRRGVAYFEMPISHHHHITCIKCDSVEDFHNPKIEKFFQMVIRKSSKFINLKDHSLELFGVCRECVK